MRVIRFLSVLCFAAANLLGIGAIVWLIWSRYPDNHGGEDVRWLYAVPVISLLVVLATRLRSSLLGLFALICSCALLAGAVFICDRMNFMVQQERWRDRGMPASPIAP